MSQIQKDVVQSIETRNVSLLQKLIKSGGASVKRDSKGRPLLVLAAEVGEPAIGKVLLDAGADINAVTLQQETPLHVAIAKRNEDFALLLLRQGAKTDCHDQHGRTPFHLIAISGLSELLEKAVESGSYFPTLDREKRFEIDLAVENDHTELAYQFFRAAMRTFPPPEGQQKGPMATQFEFLNRFSYLFKRLAHDPKIKSWEGQGFHLLDLCLRYLPHNDYRFDLLELFLNVVDVDYEPIQSKQGIRECTTELLKDSYCSIISHLRLRATSSERRLEYRDVALLVSRLPSLDLVSTLHSAFRSECLPTQEYLISQGIQKSVSPAVKAQMLASARTFVVDFWNKMDVDFSYTDESGSNLLHICLEHPYGTPARISWLIRNGVNPNHINACGDTPLHLAARNDDFRNIEILVSMGADPDIQDKQGLDCWAYAGRSHANIEQLRLCMPIVDPESLGPKKIAWLVEHAQKFNSIAAENPSIAIQTWLHDFIVYIYCPRSILPEKRWGIFLASLAAMRGYLADDPELPDEVFYKSNTDFSVLQSAIITLGLRMGRWVASLRDPYKVIPTVPRWKFCLWQKSLHSLFFAWNEKNIQTPLVVPGMLEQDFIDFIDSDDTPPQRASLIIDRKQWLKDRLARFSTEWQNSPQLGICITLVHDFVRRMYLEDRISDKDELADRIYQLFGALSLTPFLENSRIPDQESDETDTFIRLFFTLTPVANGMLKHLQVRPEEYLEKIYNRSGYDLGNKMFAIMDQWEIALRNESSSDLKTL